MKLAEVASSVERVQALTMAPVGGKVPGPWCSSRATTRKACADSLLGLEPFLIGPGNWAIGQAFLNAITNVEQGKGVSAKARDAALAGIKTAIGK
ncbi:hypothetical protein [Nonomuraea sp. NPDC003201]